MPLRPSLSDNLQRASSSIQPALATLYLCGAGNPEGVRLALTINDRQARWARIMLLDDDPAKHGQSVLGVEVTGSFDTLARVQANSAEIANLVARATPKRRSARRKIQQYNLPLASLISPNVDVRGVELGEDIIVYENASIGPQVSMAEGSVIFMGAAVGHGSRVGRCCVVAPHAVVNARVRLGDGVYVGSNATILPELNVGSWATIGAGSVVMRDVPPGVTVMGVPAKVVMTLDMKLKMRMFEFLPEAARRELAGPAR